MSRGFLALGGNLGDRRATLQQAVDALPAVGVLPVRSSAVYDTAPVGGPPDQPDYLNACLEVRTRLAPEDFLRALKALERTAGREADPVRNAPRELDVDVLLLGERAFRSDDLEIPHPRLLERRFVLIPLLELDFDLVLPDGRSCAEALAVLPLADDVRRAGPPLAVPTAGR